MSPLKARIMTNPTFRHKWAQNYNLIKKYFVKSPRIYQNLLKD